MRGYFFGSPFKPEINATRLGTDMHVCKSVNVCAFAGVLADSRMGNNVIRSKGVIWLAVENEWAVEWSQAGKMFSMNNSHLWLVNLPREEWDADTPEEVSDALPSFFSGVLSLSLSLSLSPCDPLTLLPFVPQYAVLQADFCEDPKIGDRRQEVCFGFLHEKGAVVPWDMQEYAETPPPLLFCGVACCLCADCRHWHEDRQGGY